MNASSESRHRSILKEEIFQHLTEHLSNPSENDWLIDCTFGGGGHTLVFLKAFEAAKAQHRKVPKILALDQDPLAIEKGTYRFKPWIDSGALTLKHCRMTQALPHLKDKKIVALLADLGFSTDQMEQEERGLSFRREGPLDMRLDPTRPLKACDLIAALDEKELEALLIQGGEARFARRIAQKLALAKNQNKIPQTTLEFSQLVISAIPKALRHGKTHAATQAFQALRIAVNQELEELDFCLKKLLPLISLHGRAAFLSFHSLEDRMIKHFFKQSSDWHSLFKKPLIPSRQEQLDNPSSRSAKLRVGIKKTTCSSSS